MHDKTDEQWKYASVHRSFSIYKFNFPYMHAAIRSNGKNELPQLIKMHDLTIPLF